MLIELYGQNFGCFRDEFRLSMLTTDIDPSSDRGLIEVQVDGDDEPLRLLRAVAIYGPNASGKTTVLRAASTLNFLIANSHNFSSDWPLYPYNPFARDMEANEPARLGVKAVVDGRIYDYEVHFDHAEFHAERLWRLRPDGGRDELIFRRKGMEVSGKWKDDHLFALLSKDFRPNALLLSLADGLTPSLAQNIAVGIRKLLIAVGPSLPSSWASTSSIARRARDDSHFSGWLLAQLKSADVGVVDLRTEEEIQMVPVSGGEDNPLSAAEERRDYRLTLLHHGPKATFAIPYSLESSGTKRMVELSPLLYDLARGPHPAAAFVDEIDSSLHSLLLQEIVRHFNCEIPPTEIHGQLIFVTHDTNLLDHEAKDAVLRRDQVYLTEKDAFGAARLYSVAEFKERNNHNLRRRYLQGRYGAIPAVAPFPN